MSYPSIASILKERGVRLDEATEADIKSALLEAFARDLGLGMSYLERAATTIKETGKRLLNPEDPNSPVGKQLIRLLGTDVARGLVEQKFGVAFGLYNCCGVVGAINHESLSMNVREQVMLQNGAIASADC